MRKIQFTSRVFRLLIIFAIFSCGYYQIYAQELPGSSEIGPPPINSSGPVVTLMDQFGVTKGSVGALEFFATPVEKHIANEPKPKIIDDVTHLAWYKFKEMAPQFQRKVVFSNQFGTQQWLIGKVTHLLVPTTKLEVNGAAVINEHDRNEMKHFKCYVVIEPKPTAIPNLTLIDQFKNEEIKERTLRPVLFCTPVIKNDEIDPDHYNVEEFLNGKHLACYLIPEQAINVNVKVNNQFETDRFALDKSRMLSVPSDKLSVKIGEEIKEDVAQ